MKSSGSWGALAPVLALLLGVGACATGATTIPAQATAPTKASAPVQVLMLSDIHFNPFEDVAIVPKLLTSPASDWRAIFEGRANTELGAFGRETSYTLWKSTLAAMVAAAPEPDAILISGDFVAHHYSDLFAKATNGQGKDVYNGFVDKTVQFIAGELVRTFPRAQILPALGNNDAPCGNYMSEPGSPFLAHFAGAFGDAVTPQGGTPGFVKGFSEGGYYTAAMRFNPKLRAIVLNGSFWSVRYKNGCGTNGDQAPGEAELAWLEKQLEASASRGERAWVLSHIPPGLDLFMTTEKNANPCHGTYVYMLQESFNRRFVALLERFHASVSLNITGHTHNHELHVIGVDPERSVPSLTVPAISTIYSNNPSFIVAKVNAESFVVDDFSLHGLSFSGPGSASPTWSEVYDFGRTYRQPNLSGSSSQNVLRALHDDPALRQQYINNFTARSGVPNAVFRDWKLYECTMNAFDVEHLEKCYCPGR